MININRKSLEKLKTSKVSLKLSRQEPVFSLS